jgi:hypothetical protein
MALELFDKVKSTFAKMRSRPTMLPTVVRIPNSMVDEREGVGERLRSDVDYFSVKINELFLANDRRWWVEYVPTVFVASEFIFDKKVTVLPYVVGPSLIEKLGQSSPNRMLFHDINVAGPHPFRGGKFALTVILCRTKRTDYARQLLGMVEGIVGALDFGTALSSYTKIASSAIDGIEGLMQLGDTEPLCGERIEWDSEADEGLTTGYVAIVNSATTPGQASKLRIRGKRLHCDGADAGLREFREADYVLYSIARSQHRSDERLLAFYPLHDELMSAALGPSDSDWDRAKATLLTLYQSMVLSPDLVPAQADQLLEEYKSSMVQRHKKAAETRLLKLGAGKSERDQQTPSEVTAKRLRAAAGLLQLE